MEHLTKHTTSGLSGFKQASFIVKATLFIAIAGLVFMGFYHYAIATRFSAKVRELTDANTQLQTKVEGLEKDLSDAHNENVDLAADLRAEKRRNQKFSDQIEDIAGTVSVLDKLSKTDEELLKKYSKVAFLNENYIPAKLVTIPSAAATETARNLQIQEQVWPHLEQLLAAAKDDNSELKIASAYRSFGTQGSLKSQYTVVFGTGANAFSADQGYSEHQLGTTVDFSTVALKGMLDGFDATSAYTWLTKNAYKYGFVLSYPKGNAYYQFEPWHWRFVGLDLAEYLHRAGKNFYDLDQREIDTYLVSIFD